VLVRLRETYNKDTYLPASFISDGTINILALIIALYFEEKPLIVIEEPERNLHPSLLPRVVEMLKEASTNKQIIVTTQSAEIVRHTDLADLLFITRDAKGYSEIYRPGEKEEIKTFLQNEVGIEDLYIQNLLGV